MSSISRFQPKNDESKRRIPFFKIVAVLTLGLVGHFYLSNIRSFFAIQVSDGWTDEAAAAITQATAIDETAKFTLSKCHGINSESWLTGRRLGNMQDDLNDHFVQQMILNFSNLLLHPTTNNEQLSTILGQTLCYPESSFREHNVTQPSLQSSLDDDNNDNSIVRQWAVKLIFLALHYHQHRFAIPEAEQRFGITNDMKMNQNCPSQADLSEKYGVGKFDYECPDAKYLIMALGGNGLGANVRGGMVPAMMLGLITNRVVLFMNNVQTTNASQFIQSPWSLASCPRKDYQCFFLPTSPCVVSEYDMDQAYHLSMAESRLLVRKSRRPENADHHKVWIWRTAFQPIAGFHQNAANVLFDYARTLVSSVADHKHTEYVTMLNKAVELIRTDDGKRDNYHYAAASYKVQHTITIYLMRPNNRIAKKLDHIISEIIPNNFNPEEAIGLPVRGT
jgi:hypothetical protein